MSLRIVLDVTHIRDFGIGTYIRNLVIALAKLDSENTYLLTSNDGDTSAFDGLPDNFRVVHHKLPGNDVLRQLAYPFFIKSLAPDLVHIPLNDVPLLARQPYVVTIHDMSSFLFGSRTGWRENLRLYQFRRGLMRASRVIAVSAATRRDAENLLGVPSERLRMVYGAPDPRFLERHSTSTEEGVAQVLERYQIKRPYLLYAGRIRPHKNLPRLIEAFAVVRGELENHPVYGDLRLLLIGDEISKHPQVRRAVAQTRMQNSVRFLGFIPLETLKIFYSAASAFVFPSLYEGFGLPPLEAMASGIPVVTSSVSSLPEVVGDAAVIITPENVFDIARGIREILLEDDVRARLVTAGYAQVRQFSWEKTARQTLAVYREVGSA